jgi:hypothetical protein
MTMGAAGNEGRLVVARFLDGRVLKGTTHDFRPDKAIFHLYPWGEEVARGVTVPVGALKAVFFVKTYEGDPKHEESKSFETAKGQGRKILVTFADGEVVAGFTTAFAPGKQGWFVIPVDPGSNNSRVYVVASSVRKIEWADRAVPVEPAGR